MSTGLEHERSPSPARRRSRCARQGLLRDEDGAVYVEYIVLTILVAVGVSGAVIAVGVPLLEAFRMTQVFLGAPIP